MSTPSDVAAVVCTLNSITGIEACLMSLRAAGVGQLVVVDAHSNDGTREVAYRYADLVLEDPGTGLGNARNVGIRATTLPFVLNMGSDNVMPPGQLQRMIDALETEAVHGVSAQTFIAGDDYLSRGLNAWRSGRFRVGPASVIGTPTLFLGNTLREHPYDPSTRFSDDSELCERWTREFGARFWISEAVVEEVGKTSWDEVVVRCRMYGISDHEVFRRGRESGWSMRRQVWSLTHSLRVDFLNPVARIGPREAFLRAPFLAAFAAMRYLAWGRASLRARRTS